MAAFVDGWLDTGDVLRADPDGYLYFRGRRKQIIVHDGSNISPQEIEDVLLEHPSVDSVGVIGIRDEIHGENVRAYITLREGSERPPDVELIRFARAKVGYKAPEEIVVLDEMPRTATGKVDRTALKRRGRVHAARRRQGLTFATAGSIPMDSSWKRHVTNQSRALCTAVGASSRYIPAHWHIAVSCCQSHPDNARKNNGRLLEYCRRH